MSTRESTVVRCPRCGAMDAESVEDVGIEFDRMKCARCEHSEICDREQIKDRWNETIEAELVPSEAQWTVLPDVRFAELWEKLCAKGSYHEALRRIRLGYAEPHRTYHTARHISACLRLVDDPEVERRSTRGAEIEAAIWWHDLVYDTHAKDNEEKSAGDAVATLRAAGVEEESVDRIAKYILATKRHETDESDGQLVIDIDLSILAEDEKTYARFEEEIRREYAWVDAASYRAGRSAVLRHFLDRPNIYASPFFRERWDAKARRNITWALERLAAPTAMI